MGIIGVSAQYVNVNGRSLALRSQNYYRLTRDWLVNYLPGLEPDDTHILTEGGPSITSCVTRMDAPRKSRWE